MGKRFVSAVSAALGERRVPELAELGAESAERDPVDDVVARHLLVHFGIENVIENPKQRVRRSIDRRYFGVYQSDAAWTPVSPVAASAFSLEGTGKDVCLCVFSRLRAFFAGLRAILWEAHALEYFQTALRFR